MKLKITLWLFAILSCAALTLWQKDNLSVVWREYHSYWRDNEFKDDYYYPTDRRPLIRNSIARLDPEAAAIAEIVTCGFHENEQLFYLAENLLKFPENEFFLSHFTFLLSSDFSQSSIDPKLLLKLADKLLQFNPQSPIYHYYRAQALLSCRNGNDINSVLDAVERGNQCTDYNLPYYKYKQRVIDIAQKAKLSRSVFSGFDIGRGSPSAYGLDRNILNFANAAFTNGDINLGTKICDTVYQMHRKQFLAGYEGGLFKIGQFSFSNYGDWYYPEVLELQRVNISKDRAKIDRLRLCARLPSWAFTSDAGTVLAKRHEIKEQSNIDWMALAIEVSFHLGRMFLSVLLTIFIFALLCLLFGYSKNDKIGFFKISLFAIACFCFFVIASRFLLFIPFNSLLPFNEDELCHYDSFIILEMPRVGLSAVSLYPVMASIFIAVPFVCLIILLKAKIRPSKTKNWFLRLVKRLLLSLVFPSVWIGLLALTIFFCDDRLETEELFLPFIIIAFASILVSGLSRWLCRWKIVWLILIAVLLGSLSVLAEGYLYLGYVIMILFIIFSALIAVGPVSPSMFPTRCLKLISPFIIVYWLLFVALVPMSAYRFNSEFARYRPVKHTRTLPEPNEAVYKNFLSRFDDPNLNRYDALGLIGLVMPEDLPNILEKARSMVPSPYESGGGMSYFLRLTVPRPRDPNANIDEFLTLAITSSGKDVMPILASAMIDPNLPRSLIARAKLGDITAKQPLELILAERIEEGNDSPCPDVNARWPNTPVTSAEIIPSLACVSEPNLAAQYYIDYINRRNFDDLSDESSFQRSVILLPAQQARQVIWAYLAKVRLQMEGKIVSIVGPQSILSRLENVSAICSDRNLAEELFRLKLSGQGVDLFVLSPYFTIESSGLLKKGLSSNNDKFRAWSVWQLRKVGYQFTKEEIDKLMRDASWMVRTNATVAAPLLTKDLAKKDKNPFVRFTATLFN